MNEATRFFYKSGIEALYRIPMNEGFLSLYKGLFVRVLYNVPNVAIAMSVLELVKPSVSHMLSNV